MVSMKWQWCAVCVMASMWCYAADRARAQCETATITPADGAAGDQFGTACGIDGDRIIVGAPVNNATIGAAYVFVHSPSGWMPEAKLTDVQVLPGDDFARTISISGDYAAVGASKSDRGNNWDVGSTYVYARSGAMWHAEVLAVPPWITAGSEFGSAVSVSGDAVLIGTPKSDEVRTPPTNLGNSGSAYVFRRNPITSDWKFEAWLVASDAQELDQFGFNVVLHGDTAFVTAFGDKDPTISQDNTIGSVYVFRKQGPVWIQVQKLVPSDAAAQGLLGARNFGRSLSTDGTVLLVGERSGQSAYVFRFNGSLWVEEAILKKPVGNTAQDMFGQSVAIQGDTALVGAPLDDDNALSNSGSIFVYKRSSGIWVFDSIFYGSSPAASGRLGSSLAVDGVYAVAGAISPTTSGQATVLAVQTVPDCDGNLVQDECQLRVNPGDDSNGNGHIDVCECTLDSECNDNLACTENACDVVSGRCVFTPLPGFCLIAGMCHDDGTIHPDNECQQCDVSLSVTTWSNRPHGTACPDDGNVCTRNICVSGFCSHPGEPAGLPCGDASDSACDMPDSCSGDGLCLKNFASSSTNCDDGLFCNGGSERCNGQGTCVPLTPIPCSIDPSLPLCDEVNDVCVQCLSDADCTGGGECPGTVCDVNGLCQLDPAQIGTACGDPTTTQCTLPDTCTAADTCAPHHVPDGTPCSPDADPCTFDVCVSGTCMHDYDLSVGKCGPFDCNCNSIADACDIALGLSADCDGNAKPDDCDLPLFTAQSPQLSPIGAGFAQSFTLSAPPKATGNVTLRFAARGDFLAATEKVAISVNGMAAGEIFTFSGLDCPVTPDEDELVMTAALFNQWVGGGDATIDLVATVSVDAGLCVPASWISVSIQYRDVQAGDCNGNGELDACEPQQDCNHNGVPDICEPDCDGNGVPDACQYSPNCNYNGRPDHCDIIDGTSSDCNGNWIPDECELDCQLNSVADECEIATGSSFDCDDDSVPDECPNSVQEIHVGLAQFVTNEGVVLVKRNTNRVDVFRQTGESWVFEAQLMRNSITSGLGVSRDLAAFGCDNTALECCQVDVCVYRRDAITGWHFENRLISPFSGKYFVPQIAISGQRIAVSDAQISCPAPPGLEVPYCGGVAVFEYFNGGWILQAALQPESPGNLRFGNSLAMDGNWLAVGEAEANVPGTPRAGQVHLYKLLDGTWQRHTQLTPPLPTIHGRFGFSVALAGPRLLVNSPYADNANGINSGIVDYFELQGNSWVHMETLSLDDECHGCDLTGSMDYEDPYLALGVNDGNFGDFQRGRVYILVRSGSVWTPFAYAVARPPYPFGYDSIIGNAVGLGNPHLLIGERGSQGNAEYVSNINIVRFLPSSCHCPPVSVTFVDPPDGLIDARQSYDVEGPLTSQGLQSIIVAQDEHSGTDCWRFQPYVNTPIEGIQVDGVAYNGDGTYTVQLPIPMKRFNHVTYTDQQGEMTTGTFIRHPGNVDGGPFADANDALAHAQCCLGGSMCGAEYDHYRCDMNHSAATTAEDLIRVLDLLNGAGVYSPQLGTPLPAGP